MVEAARRKARAREEPGGLARAGNGGAGAGKTRGAQHGAAMHRAGRKAVLQQHRGDGRDGAGGVENVGAAAAQAQTFPAKPIRLTTSTRQQFLLAIEEDMARSPVRAWPRAGEALVN